MSCQGAPWSAAPFKALFMALMCIASLVRDRSTADAFIVPPRGCHSAPHKVNGDHTSQLSFQELKGVPHAGIVAFGVHRPSKMALASRRSSFQPALRTGTQEEEIGVGRLIVMERPKDARPFLALVIGKEGKRNMIVCDREGRQFMAYPKDLRWLVPGSGYVHQDLESFEASAAVMEEGVDRRVEEAWEAIVTGDDPQASRSMAELSTLLCSDDTATSQFCAYWALEVVGSVGHVFFDKVAPPMSDDEKAALAKAALANKGPQAWGGGGARGPPPPVAPVVYAYRARTAEEVEQGRATWQAEASRRASQRGALEGLLGTRDEHGRVDVAQLPEDFRDVLPYVQNLALQCHFGDHTPLSAQAEAKALDLLEALGRPRHRTAALDALIDLGVWDVHENLDLHRHQLPLHFDDQVMSETRRLLDSPPPDPDLTRRVDHRHLPLVAIDDACTKEVDDAICLEDRGSEGSVLWVVIADPTRFIDPDSPLFHEALRRQTSMYLPTGTVPMFPMELAAGPMSLLAGVDRPALSIGLHICPTHGNITKVEVTPSLVNVRAQLTFHELDHLLQPFVESAKGTEGEDGMRDGDLAAHMPPPPPLTGELCPAAVGVMGPMLPPLWALGRVRRRFRMANGAMEALGTSALSPDATLSVERLGGYGRQASYDVRLDAPRSFSAAAELIMEVMVAANEGVAILTRTNNIPTLYRTQAPPQVRGSMTIGDAVAKLPPGLCRNFAARRFFSPSFNQARAMPHAGLGVGLYVQSTSPIRRFTDLLCHYNLKAWLRKQVPPFNRDRLTELATTQMTSAASVRNRVSREAEKYWLLQHLRSCGPEVLHRGMVLGHARGGHGMMTVLLLDVPIEITVKAPELATKLGSEVTIRVLSVSERSDSYEAVVVPQSQQSAAAA